MQDLMLLALSTTGIIWTALGLGGLIFFHELGHFVACRLTGTRVEAFSVGFGPEIFGWTRGHTRYKFSLVLLGGYVKMAAENPGEENTGAPDEFPNKSFGQRLFIMANGVIFNAILAFVLFAWAFGIGVPFTKPEIGHVAYGEPAWQAGLRSGDVVTHINGRKILGFEDIKTEVAFSGADEVLILSVQRGDDLLDIPVEPAYSSFNGMPGIGVNLTENRAADAVEDDSPVAKVGGKKGDVVIALEGREVTDAYSLSLAVQNLAGVTKPGDDEMTVSVRVRREDGSEEDLRCVLPLVEIPRIGITPYAGRRIRSMRDDARVAEFLKIGDELISVDGREVEDLRVLQDAATPGQPVQRVEIERDGKRLVVEKLPKDLTLFELANSIAGKSDLDSSVVSPRSGMPARKAGLLAGDRILTVGETTVSDWEGIFDAIQAHGRKPVDVTVAREGVKEPITLRVEPGGLSKFPTLGYLFATPQTPHKESNLVSAMAMGWRRTVLTMESVILTVRSLITQRVSVKKLGGPIMIAQITYKVQESGLAHFLYILAIISINLAILNLLPIPVLDGGQIVLLTAEKIRGKPLPERVVGALQLVGLVAILGLMALVFTNDIMRLFQ